MRAPSRLPVFGSAAATLSPGLIFPICLVRPSFMSTRVEGVKLHRIRPALLIAPMNLVAPLAIPPASAEDMAMPRVSHV